MTLLRYKNINTTGPIDENRGQRIEERDRKIFERNNAPASFGISERDNVEFALYDMSDNLLEWKTKDADNIILSGGEKQRTGGSPEIVVDPSVDINDVGYDKGAFRVSYQFLRNRVGSNIDIEKVYIKEISPSRTEVRILPVFTGVKIVDEKMKEYFNHFKTNDLDKTDMVEMTNIITQQITPDMLDKELRSLFVSRFQHDYVVSNTKLQQIYNSIINDIRVELVDVLVKESQEFISIDRFKRLFRIVLDRVVDKYIPQLNEE